MTSVRITLPNDPDEREEIITFLEEKGLIDRNDVPPSLERKPERPKGKSRWAAFAEEMHRKSPLDGESENLLRLIRQGRAGNLEGAPKGRIL